MNVSLPGGLSGLGTDLTSRLVASLCIGQETRLIQIDTPLPTGTLVVERFRLDEGVHEHEPFWAEVDCLSTNAHLELKALIGGCATLRLKRADGQWRHWHGYIVQAGNLGSDGGAGAYRLRLAAFTHWLQQRRDTRIFQDATASDIVSTVLSAYPQARFRIEVASAGPARDITTQYRETDWAFVTRLLAREGWSWYLEHDDASTASGPTPGIASHTLVIFDASASRPQLGPLHFGRPDLRQADVNNSLTDKLMQGCGLNGNWATDKITAWHTGRTLGSNVVTKAAWDPRQLQGIGSSASSLDASAGPIPPLEHYAGHGQPQANPPADAHLAALQLTQQWATGQSAVRKLRPAAVFLFEDDAQTRLPPGASTPAFCVLTVTHEAANNLGTQAARILRRTDVESGSYRNHFRACPAAMRIAPPPPACPTVSGLQTALVMSTGDSPIHTDRDLRIRVQFAWQRGRSPLPGALTAPTAPSGQATGHAPGDAQSGTWVRVAHGLAGPNWGTHFTPRAGTEVLVDFLDGDIDHPIVVGQLHNGAHDVPWPAGEGSDANHAGAISGWHHAHLDGQGINQWLIDDTTGQLRMRLASHGALGDHSELTLGRIVRQSVRGGSGQGQRGQWLGEGFYGYTDGWAILRASEGLLLTSSTRPAQGASVDSTQMDAREAVARLHASQSLGKTLGQSARQQGALGLRSHDDDQAVSQHTAAIDPTAKGRYEGPVNGQDPRKTNRRTPGDPVERFHRPLLHLDAAASAIWVSPSSLSLFSGEHTSMTLQGDAHLSSAHTLSSVSGQTTSL
jgi:type VI secretion system secreted protein VgrG